MSKTEKTTEDKLKEVAKNAKSPKIKSVVEAKISQLNNQVNK